MKLFNLLLAGLLLTSVTLAQDAVLLKNQRELFVDNFLIDKLDNIENRLAVPVSAGTAIRFDKPWEGNFCAYVSVIYDGEKYSMYYRGVGDGKDAAKQVTCYAESKDGINWHKPNLRLFKVYGTYDNNVVMIGGKKQVAQNFSVMYDNRPGVPKEERYKAVGGVATTKKRPMRGLYRYVSADGVSWKAAKDSTALFPDGHGLDSQNVPAWLPSENQYAIYLRTWTGDKPGDEELLKGVRTVARSVSPDFVNWSEPKVMTIEGPLEDLYTNATQPYFRAPQLIISMPFRYAPDIRVLSDEEMKANSIPKNMWAGVSDAVLMTSRGGNSYERKFQESFIRPGLSQKNWGARSTMPALGIVPTGDAEMSMYVIRAYGTPQCFLERMQMRVDGFSSLHAGAQEGLVLTRPVILDGKSFRLNYSASSLGYVKVLLQDENGTDIPGFGAADAEFIRGDKTDSEVKWKSGKSIQSLLGKKIRIKFVIKDADVYSFRIL